MAAKDRLLAWPEFPTIPGESSFMLMKTLAALAFATGVRGGSVCLNSSLREDKWCPAGFRLLRIAAAG